MGLAGLGLAQAGHTLLVLMVVLAPGSSSMELLYVFLGYPIVTVVVAYFVRYILRSSSR